MAAAIDETSYRRGHEYLTLVARMQARRAALVWTGKGAGTIGRFATYLSEHGAVRASQLGQHPHVAHFHQGASRSTSPKRGSPLQVARRRSRVEALDVVRWQQQKLAPQLEGTRWTLLNDADKTELAQLTDLEALVSQGTSNRTAGALRYREQWRGIVGRKQINVVSGMLPRVGHERHAFQGRAVKDVVGLVPDISMAWA